MIKIKPLVLIFLAVSFEAEANPDPVDSARDAVLEWLVLVDDLQYETSWTEASSILRSSVSRTDWVRNLDSMRGSLGALKSRNADTSEFHETLEEMPDGEYFIFTFKSAFENQSFAYEVVGVVRESDASWRVMGYYFD